MKSGDRDITVDLLRGIAILLMLVTHINGTFFSGSFLILDKLTFTGATVCFSTFLFCSSMIFGMKLSKGNIKTKAAYLRSRKLLLVYYLLALFILIVSIRPLNMAILWEVVTLQRLPIYIEFIIAFFFFDIFTYFSQSYLKRILQKPALLLLLSVVIYIVSRWLNILDWGDGYINTVKSTLVGHGEIHSFGLFSYFPIYSFGLVWGYRFFGKSEGREIMKYISIITIIAVVIGENFISLKWERWPPTLLFHLYGIAFISTSYFLAPYLCKVKAVARYLYFMSRKTLHFYVLHVVLIFLGIKLLDNRYESWLLIILMNVALFILTSILTLTIDSFAGYLQGRKE